MLIRLLTSFSGGISGDVGDVVDAPDAEARRFVTAGYAETVEIETAMVSPADETRGRRGKNNGSEGKRNGRRRGGN